MQTKIEVFNSKPVNQRTQRLTSKDQEFVDCNEWDHSSKCESGLFHCNTQHVCKKNRHVGNWQSKWCQSLQIWLLIRDSVTLSVNEIWRRWSVKWGPTLQMNCYKWYKFFACNSLWCSCVWSFVKYYIHKYIAICSILYLKTLN